MMYDFTKKSVFFRIVLILLFSFFSHLSFAAKKHHVIHHSRVHHKPITHKKHRSIHKLVAAKKATETCDDSKIDLNQFAQTTSIPGLAEDDTNTTNLVDYITHAVSHLRYSDYKLGGSKFDASRGVYVVDCSNFVDHILAEASPHAYSSLVHATRTDSPATQHYYNFFKELSVDSDSYWNKVERVSELQPGDILVFRYKNRHGMQTGGHVMVVMNKPLQNEEVFLVRVADSARSGHSEDTRPTDTSGIGIGTLLLKANPHSGHPAAYAWGLNGYWNHNVNIAMARPLDMG